MCFFYSVATNKKAIQEVFNAEFQQDGFSPVAEANGFTHPYMPIITNAQPNLIIGANWGLIPTWAKDTAIAKNTLNARIETLTEKPSFKEAINNRCLIPATNFFEWQWLDQKGKNKQKFSIYAQQEIFAFAGLYSEWTNPFDNLKYITYTIVTQPANPLMAKIHNTKQRMPLILNPQDHNNWLNNTPIHYFQENYNVQLQAFPINNR